MRSQKQLRDTELKHRMVDETKKWGVLWLAKIDNYYRISWNNSTRSNNHHSKAPNKT